MFQKLFSKLNPVVAVPPIPLFYTPSRRTTKEQDLLLQVELKSILENEAFVLFRDIWISMSENSQLRGENPEYERHKREGVEDFLLTMEEVVSGTPQKKKFDRHLIIN